MIDFGINDYICLPNGCMFDVYEYNEDGLCPVCGSDEIMDEDEYDDYLRVSAREAELEERRLY